MKIRALIVDRRSAERSELALPLTQAGVEKIVEVNVHELAAKPIHTGQYDAVFVEFNTLMEAGLELAQSLRAMAPDVALIVTYPDTARVADLQKYCPQASAYLASPFTSEQLRDVIETRVPAAAV